MDSILACASHVNKPEHLGGRCQKAVRWVRVGQGQLVCRQHNLMRERGFPQGRGHAHCVTARAVNVVWWGFLPVTGIPLPLFSYGGSSALFTFLALGVVMNIRMRRFVN